MARSGGVSNVSKQKPFLQVVQYVSAKDDLKGYQQVLISDILSNETPKDLTNRYVEGEVMTAFPCFQTKRGWSKKLIVGDKDPDEGTTSKHTIPVFLRGPHGEECTDIKEKDTIIILGAKLDTCSSDKNPFQVIADSSKRNLKVWLVKAPNSTINQEVDSALQTKSCSGHLNIAPPPAKKPKLSQQPYTKIADLQDKTTVNLYGVVKFFKSPFKTRGSDFCTTVSVVDPTIQSLEHCSFKSVMFAKTKERLPQVRSVGNIVRFLKMGVGQFGSELQGKKTPDLSWLVFDGSPGAPIEPIASYPGSYTITDLDKEIIQELRTWSCQHQSLKPATYDKIIAEISPNNQFFDLACQITAKARTSDGKSIVLTVFDGTTPHCHAVQADLIDKTTKVMADESVCCKAAGKTVDIHLHEDHANGVISEELHPGEFILLNNVHAVVGVQRGQSELPETILAIHKKTICGRGVKRLGQNDPRFAVLQERLDSLPENPESAKARKGEAMSVETGSVAGQKEGGPEAEENIASMSDPLDARALQTSCTVTEHPYIPFSTIEGIRSSPKIPSKFRCRAKALAYLPDSVKCFVQNCCHSCKVVLSESGCDACPGCGQQVRGEYLFSLVLEDETGFLHAMLFHQDAQTFLPDLPSPDDFLRQPDHQDKTKQILTSLTQNPENLITQSKGPTVDSVRQWLECCVASYSVSEKGSTSTRVLYRIFDTTCVID